MKFGASGASFREAIQGAPGPPKWASLRSFAPEALGYNANFGRYFRATGLSDFGTLLGDHPIGLFKSAQQS